MAVIQRVGSPAKPRKWMRDVYKRQVLLDVRTPQEYQEGHIPESKNVPLQQLDNIASVAKNKDIPLFRCV